MARLNDPPSALAETIENLKKRYIRQNREIARANSQQSIRIRTLEAEAHLLLSQNLALKEEIIRLKAELERRDNARELLLNVSATKSILEGKMREMTEILGGMKTAVNREKAPNNIREEKREKQPPKPYVLAPGQEGLPSIAEDRVHPRQSLSLEEVHVLTPISPVLGFSDSEDDEMMLSPPVCTHLDMRPRRQKNSSDLPLATPPMEDTQMPKSSQKNEISPETTKLNNDKTFEFMVLEKKTQDRKEDHGDSDPVKGPEDPKPGEYYPSSFGAKVEQRNSSTNGKISLPTVAEVSGQQVAAKTEVSTTKPRKPAHKLTYPLLEITPIERMASAERKPLGTKTANASPQKRSDPSMKFKPGKEVKDTAPPTAMSALDRRLPSFLTGETASNEESGRTSRRSRAAVNYALPNLRDKMRRDPTEEPSKRKRTSTNASGIITERDSTSNRSDSANLSETRFVKGSENEEVKRRKRATLDFEKENDMLAPTEDLALEHDAQSLQPTVPTISSYHRGKRRVSSLHSSLDSGDIHEMYGLESGKAEDVPISGNNEDNGIKQKTHEWDGNTGLNGIHENVFVTFDMLPNNITISRRRASIIGTSRDVLERGTGRHREDGREDGREDYCERHKSRRKTTLA